MGDVIDFLVFVIAVVFFISSMFSIVKSTIGKGSNNPKKREIDRKLSDMFSEDGVQPDQLEDDEPYIPAYEEVVETQVHEKMKTAKVQLETEMKMTKTESGKRNKMILQEDKGMDDESFVFTKNDIIRGFIFKEILDKPRTKRPYRPPNYRN